MRKYLQPYESKALDEVVAELRKTPKVGTARMVGQGMLAVAPDRRGGFHWEIKGRTPPHTRLTGHIAS